MKKETTVVIFFVIIFLILKVFEDSIPKITDPLTNILVLIAFFIFTIIYGALKPRKKSERK